MKAIILSGGKSSRMGQDKALMQLGDKLVIEHSIENLSAVFDEIFISGNCAHYPVSLKIIPDDFPEKGPMGGIYSALKYCKEDVFVCSCDMPFVSVELIQNILHEQKENKINVVRCLEKIYPVLGIYPYSVLDDLEQSIELSQLKMIDFLEQQNANYIQLHDDWEEQLLNINTPQNFKHAENLITNIK